MDTYSRMYKLWKYESFRLHAANMDKEYRILELNNKIEQLNKDKLNLQSEEVKPFSIKHGKTKAKIKELLRCDDEYAKQIISTYSTPEKKKQSVTKMIYKFVEALVGA